MPGTDAVPPPGPAPALDADAGPSQFLRRGENVLTRGLRRIRIGWRVALIGIVNLLALIAIAALLWAGSDEVRAAWTDLRAAHVTTGRIGDLERAVYRLHREVRAYLDKPDEAHRGVVETAKLDFTGSLWRAEDMARGPSGSENGKHADARADMATFSEVARRYLFGFDALRGLEFDIALLYENDFADLQTEVRRRLDALDLAIRPGDAVLRPLVAAAYDRFAEFRIQLVGYRHDRDHMKIETAREARDAFEAALREIGRSPTPDSRGYAIELFQPHLTTMDAIFERIAEIADKRARALAGELEGSRATMMETLAQAVERQHRREDEAIERFAADSRTMLERFLVLAAGFLLLSVVTGLAVVNSIRRPLWELRGSILTLLAGESAAPVGGTEAPDEIGATARKVEEVRLEVRAAQTRQKELADLERRWLSVLETGPIGISVQADEDLRLLFRNRRWYDLFGQDPNDRGPLPGHDGFFSPTDAAELAEAVRTDTIVSAVLRQMVRADGTPWWAILELRPIDFSGQPAHILWVWDVTARRRAEEDLRTAKEAAETALADLAEAQRSLIEAEKLAAIGGLVAGVAHEVNNPVGIGLTVATSFCEKVDRFREELTAGPLRRSRLDDFVAQAAEAARQITTNLMRAADLVQSFKQVAVDRTHPDRRRFDLAEATEQIAASLRPGLRTTRLRLDVDIPYGIVVDGYPGAWGQVLTNLFVNAQMHAFPGGREGVMSVRARTTGGDRVEIVFSDDGIGMPADISRRAFEPFFTTRRGSGGSGLGLHIVWNIVVHRFGGTIRLTTAPDGGTRFVMTIPPSAPEESADTSEPTAPGGAA